MRVGGSKNLKLLPLIAAGVAIVAVVTLERLLATPSESSPALLQFIGRFHPLAVHLPIGVLLFVAFAEALCLVPSLRPKIEPALPYLLPFLLVAAVGSFALGLFLAHGGGYPQRLVRLHRLFTLGGVVGSALLFGLYLSRDLLGAALSRGLYRGALVLTVGAISYGAHHGGSMTRGEGYLFQYAPAFVQRLAGYEPKKPQAPEDGGAKPRGTEAKVFTDAVLPVLRRTCFECHGEATQKGGLRVDSLEAIMKGGDGGPAVVAGNATRSSIVTRMTLPIGNDERMPPENKPAPTPEEIALVRFWIDRGANDTLLVRDVLVPDDARKVLEATLAATPAPDASTAPSGDPAAPPTAIPTDTPPTPDTSTSGGASPDTTTGGATPTSTGGSTSGGGTQPPASDQTTAYARHVAPILEAKCVSCHGASKQKGKLRLDSFDALFSGGKGGPAVIASRSAASPLVARARLPIDHDEHMPPAKEPQLDDNQVALLAWWIDAGASKETAAAAVPAKLLGASKPPVPTSTGTGTPPTSTGTPPAPTGVPTTTPPSNDPPAGSSDPTGKPPPGQVFVYRDVVAKVVGKKCGSCHASPGPSGGLDVMTYEGLLASSVVAGKPEESSLLQRALLPLDDDDHMPPPALPQPSAAELEVVRAWIQSGARRDALVAHASIPAEVATAVELPAPEAPSDTPPLPSASAPRPTHDDGPQPLQGGGCAACTVNDGLAGGASALGFATLVAVAWTLRRRRLP